MGYDMYLKAPRIPEPMVNWKDEQSRADYFAWQNDSHSYLRRNIFGMSAVRDNMEKLGMGFWAEDYLPRPGYPNSDAYGVDFEEWEGTDGEWHSGWQGERAEEYEKALAEHLAWHGPEVPGIPLHKFCSNDGWHVTKEECRAALHLYEQAVKGGEAHPESFYTDLIPFLREGGQTDGFEVN